MRSQRIWSGGVVYHDSPRDSAFAPYAGGHQAAGTMRRTYRNPLFIGLLGFFLGACGDKQVSNDAGSVPLSPPAVESIVDDSPVPEAPPRVLRDPVPVYAAGEVARVVEGATEPGLFVLDVGDDWSPYLFTESEPGGPVMPHPYRATYLALARGEYPDDYQGERAREDKYLELYGIPPTITLLRSRLEHLTNLACEASIDVGVVEQFVGTLAFDDAARAVAQARRLAQTEHVVTHLRETQHAAAGAPVNVDALARAEQTAVREYERLESRFHVIDAIQRRLRCEGYFEGRGRFVRGAFDGPTHEAIADFERRHRLFGWGNVGRDTLAALRKSGATLEHEAVIRVLTERAMHQAGVIEDGSASTGEDGRANTYPGPNGRDVPVPNLERAFRERIVEAFGLVSPAATLAFLRSLETIGPTRYLAMADVARPAYYAPDMDLSVDIDRGDVWYEFPYDEHGVERGQGVSRRPSFTLFVTYQGRRIPLVRFGTTIGGWRTEMVDGVVMWAYKDSPVGPVVWDKIVASPVWLPPESAPPRSLLVRQRGGYAPNRHETGPSYASAYGLVAAYHRPYLRDASGNIQLRGDQGIRSHGSVDYMSIARRFSHGCHRLHNHMAVRMMSFVLAHRAHTRRGEAEVHYSRSLEFEGQRYTLTVDHGGYEFVLARPIPVEVLAGRILGTRMTAITTPLPRYDSTIGAYMLPDGGAATVDRNGTITPLALDAGVPLDAGILDGAVRDAGVPLDAGLAHDAGGAPHDAATARDASLRRDADVHPARPSQEPNLTDPEHDAP